MAESLFERLRRRSPRHFESRLPAFDPRKTNGVLSDAVRAGRAALGAAQDWLGEQVPQIPEVPEEYYEVAQ